MLFPKLDQLATPEVISLPDTASVQSALKLMKEHRIRALVVVSCKGYKLLHARDLVSFHLQGIDFSVPLAQVHLPLAPQLLPDSDVDEAIRLIGVHQVEQLCLVDDEGKLQGIVSYTDLVQSLDPELLAESQSLGELLRGVQVLQVNKEMPARVVLSLMQQQQVSTALISEECIPLGIVTQTDVIHLLEAGDDLIRPVEQVMSSPVFTLPASISIQHALASIREKRFKRLVVVDDSNRVVGLISQQDLLSIYYNQWFGLLKQQQEELTQANQELLQRNQLLSLVLDEINHAVLVIQSNNQVMFSNQVAEQLLGYSPSALLDTRLDQLLAGSARSSELQEFYERLRLGLQASVQCELLLDSGSSQSMKVQAKPLLAGEDPLVLITFIPKPDKNYLQQLN
ncbi:CBS domain-containing protein [Marinospirillum sp.]|uniref:CBS domain-containing protein n=1 Tax=Marinospirillum sp. TaxID=2183934 RepID=UPI0028702110|nr:CBS domain-containing protein [Marinospirillum sp.]MDR9468080.1 CBS domain-containing protein [Marinospirillum sp.]